jgi:membrane dipeptidase
MKPNYLIVDAHEDLAWNMLTFGRDYTFSAHKTRALERGKIAPLHIGDTLVGWKDYQDGKVAVVFSTLFAAPLRSKMGQWDILSYDTPDAAHQSYRKQVDAYHRLAEDHPEKYKIILSAHDLDEVLAHWQRPLPEDALGHPVGLLILMEAAEGVRNPAELEEWWGYGVRVIGPAWAGTRFCGGTREPGPLTKEGYALLDGMADLGFVLDISHMDEKAVLESLDHYPGRIIASHANAQALLKGHQSNRFLSNRVIHGLVERGGVIGLVPFNPFLVANWSKSDGREAVSLWHLVDQIDHICQAAGSAQHAGIGSDFDGAFGLQSVPAELDTIADLGKLVRKMEERGYREEDIQGIMGGNWIRLMRETLPEEA